MEKNQRKLIFFMPSMEGGGVEKNIIIIANYLATKIKDISLITFDKKFNRKFNKRINIINSNYSSKKKYSKYFKYFVTLLLLVKEIFKNKKILVFCFQANMYCIILSKLFNFKLIVRSNSSPSGWSKNFVKNFIFKILLKIPDAIIVNSKNFKKELDNRFNVNSYIIYNPLNKNEIISKSKQKIFFNFYKKSDLKLINVARFTDQKDHLTLLKAFNNVQKKIKAKLILIGYGVNREKISSFIKKHHLTKKVKIINCKENPYKYIRISDIFILSSIYEGLPNVLLEAIALKKFIISSNCPTGPAEILKNGEYGILFKPNDWRSLSKKIIYFSKNKNKLEKKINLAYYGLDRFDYSNNCNKYLQLVSKII